MFTLPPWPPKDYFLKAVPDCYRSDSVFTPLSLPRPTQTNLSKYLVPIQYRDDERVKIEIQYVHKKLIEKWGDRERAEWVDKPGKNAYFLHDLFRQFNYDSDFEFNPIFQHKEKVFNRPFSLELDCLEYRRLKKLQQKSDRECDIKCRKFQKIEEDKRLKQQEEELMKVISCDWQPPFWYSSGNNKEKFDMEFEPKLKNLHGNTHDEEQKFAVWREIPHPLEKITDSCERRRELSNVGLPFRNEACNWYFQNYPPPKLKLILKKFSI